MSIGETTTRLRQLELAQAERREHRRAAGGAEGRVDLLHEPGVAQLQLAVGDAPAAREQVEGEQHRRLLHVARDPLEPLEAALGGALGALHDRAAVVLVGRQRGGEVARMLAQRPGQPDRVLERQLGAGADREVRGVRGVAEQHDVLVVPCRVADGHEVDPARVVADQAVAVERAGEQLLAERDARGVALARRQGARAVEPRAPPGLLRGLHDERAHRVAVRIAVDLEDAVLGLGDEELEGVEHELRAEPHVLRPARDPATAGTRPRAGSAPRC